jgi:hypothetical protein
LTPNTKSNAESDFFGGKDEASKFRLFGGEIDGKIRLFLHFRRKS